MGGVIGGVNAALPEAFEPPQLRAEAEKKAGFDLTAPCSGVSPSSAPSEATTSGATFTAEFPSDTSYASGEVIAGKISDVTNGANGAAVVAAAAAFRAAVDGTSPSQSSSLSSLGSGGRSTTMMAALLPLLARLPPICPGPRLTIAVPSLLLLAVRVLGAVSGRTLGFAAAGSRVSSGDGVRGQSSSTAMEAEAAVDFVRSCVREVWLHGNLSQQQEANAVDVGDEAGASAAEGGVAAKTEGVSTAASSGTGGENVMAGATGSVAEQADNDIDDDDWGDDDFQGAEGDFQGSGDDGGPGDGDDDTAAVNDSSAEVETEQEEAPTAVEGSPGDTEPTEEAGEVGEARDNDSSSSGGQEESETQEEQALGAKGEEAELPSAEGNEDDCDDASPSVDSSGSRSDSPVVADSSGSASGSADVVDTTMTPASTFVEGNEEASAGVVVNSPEMLNVGEVDAPAREETTDEKDRGVEEAKEAPSVPENVEDGDNSNGASGAAAAAAGSAGGGVSNTVVSQKEDGAVVDENTENGAESSSSNTAGTTPPIVIADALSLVLAAGRAVNELLSYLLNGQGVMNERAAAIGAAAEAWGAIALAIPQEVDELAEPLRAALTAPVEKCSVATRLALLHAVAVTVKAAAGGIAGEKESGAASMTSQPAAAALLRLLAPHALAGVRLEVDRAAAAAAGGNDGVVDEEPREACLLKGVHVAQLAFMVSIHCILFGWRDS